MQHERMSPTHLKNHSLNRTLSSILSFGVAFIMIVIAAGLILYSFKGINEVERLVPLPSLLGKLIELSPSALITTGLVIMLLLPQVVLLVSLIHFIAEGQKKPAVISAVLLTMVIVSAVLLFVMK